MKKVLKTLILAVAVYVLGAWLVSFKKEEIRPQSLGYIQSLTNDNEYVHPYGYRMVKVYNVYVVHYEGKTSIVRTTEQYRKLNLKK